MKNNYGMSHFCNIFSMYELEMYELEKKYKCMNLKRNTYMCMCVYMYVCILGDLWWLLLKAGGKQNFGVRRGIIP